MCDCWGLWTSIMSLLLCGAKRSFSEIRRLKTWPRAIRWARSGQMLCTAVCHVHQQCIEWYRLFCDLEQSSQRDAYHKRISPVDWNTFMKISVAWLVTSWNPSAVMCRAGPFRVKLKQNEKLAGAIDSNSRSRMTALIDKKFYSNSTAIYSDVALPEPIY